MMNLATIGHDGKHYDQSETDKYLKKGSDEIKYRECKKCHRDLPLTAENFYRDKYRAEGFMPTCKNCKKKEYQEKKANLKKKNMIIINPEDIEVEVKINSDNEISINEWVKSLPEEKRKLLDPTKISAKIRKELFGKE